MLTVGMVALAGIVVSAASYFRAGQVSDDYNDAMKADLRNKGLAYGQTAQSLLDLVRTTSPEAFAALVQQTAENPEGIFTSYSADEQGQSQDELLALGVWVGNPSTAESYTPFFWHDLAGRQTSAENPVVQSLLAETAITQEPATRVDDKNHGLLYTLAVKLNDESSAVAVVTLDASQEFAFISAQQSKSTRGTIEFAAASILFVGVVAGALSLLLSRSLTNRKNAEEALRDSEVRYRTLAELAPAGVFRTDMQGRTLYGNERAQDLFGQEPDPGGGPLWTRSVHPEQQERVRAEWQDAVKRGTDFQSECRLADVDGRAVWIQAQLAPEREPGGKIIAYVGTAADITERVLMEETLREQALRDRLTGLLNHAAIMDELERLIGSAEHGRFAVAMIDVDDMKSMNDTYGHPIGDQALYCVGQALKRNGATVGRYGGDEFVVILPGHDRAAAADYRREVLDELAETGLVDPATASHVPVAITVGFSLYPEEAETVADLIRLADSAMYAERRERAAAHAGRARSSATVEDRAAAMIGEIVPLLTSAGDTQSKLQSVAHRLVLGLGYDGVSIMLFSAEPGGPAVSSTVARVADQLVDAWDEEQAQDGEASRLRTLLEQVQRPFIIDNLSDDERLSPKQRELLQNAELRSGLVVPMFRQGHTLGAIAVGSRQPAAFGADDARLLTSVSGQVTAIVHMAALVEELQVASTSLGEARSEAVVLLAAAAEAHDPTTGRHLQSVRHLAEAIARELGHPAPDAEAIGLAAVLHDIGKIRVPDSILTSPTELTIQQWDVMRRHTTWGADFLAGREGFALAAIIARGHHERWDGTGYPDRLSGDDIPEAAAIVAVADCFDAITQDRPYQSAQPVEWAVREISASSGKQFSPRVVDALLRLHERGQLAPFAPDGAEQQKAA